MSTEFLWCVKSSPLWLTRRASWTLNGSPAYVPLFAPYGLSAQLGTTQYSVRKRFRQTIVAWIRKVKAFWPECPAEISKDDQLLIVRSSRQRPAIGHAGVNAHGK